MENSINSISLQEISYPVFKLGTNKPLTESGVTFYYHQKQLEEGELVTVRIVDDKNMPQETLSLRRLQLSLETGVSLFRISKAIYFLGDLIKISTPQTWFIDNTGRVFNYKKTSRAKLKIYPIAQLIPIKTGGVIVEAKGILTRFKALYVPETGMDYVGILHWGKSLILYGFYEQQHDDSWRMV